MKAVQIGSVLLVTFSIGLAASTSLLGTSVVGSELLWPKTSEAEVAAVKSSPKVQVAQTIELVYAVTESLSGEARKEERRKKLREITDVRFDFAEMARRALGPTWDEITAEQQAEFVKLFSDLLAKTYLARVEEVKRGQVTIGEEKVDDQRAIVKTMVKVSEDSFPIDYRLRAQGGEWRVYDVVIENIGLVSNYRNEFGGIVKNEKFEGLMTKLRAKK